MFSFFFFSICLSECPGDGIIIFKSKITRIENNEFNGCTDIKGDLTIPNTILSIGEYAFANWGIVENNLIIGIIDIPDNFSIKYFNNTIFKGKLILNSSVISIGSYAFCNCSGFTGSLEIPSSVTSIGQQIFANWTTIEYDLIIGIIDIPCNFWNKYFSNIIFKGKLILNSSVISIGNYAFADWGTIENDLIIGIIDIPNNFYKNVFYNSTFKGKLILNSSVKSIGRSAFYGCNGFTGSLEIPSSVTSIGDCAFSNWETIENNLIIGIIDIPDNFYSYYFYNSTFKGRLILNSSVMIIGWYAFSKCCGFSGQLEIPSSITSIGWYAFADCSGFTGSLEIPSSVASIGWYAFADCSGFSGNLTISSNNIKIGKYAFSDTGLNQIIVKSENINAICSPSSFNENIIYINVPENYNKTKFCGIDVEKHQSSNSARKKPSNLTNVFRELFEHQLLM